MNIKMINVWKAFFKGWSLLTNRYIIEMSETEKVWKVINTYGTKLIVPGTVKKKWLILNNYGTRDISEYQIRKNWTHKLTFEPHEIQLTHFGILTQILLSSCFSKIRLLYLTITFFNSHFF